MALPDGRHSSFLLFLLDRLLFDKPGDRALRWSIQGGDLRIGHFLGIHAPRLIPLVALGLVLLARRFPVLRPEGPRTARVVADRDDRDVARSTAPSTKDNPRIGKFSFPGLVGTLRVGSDGSLRAARATFSGAKL